MVEPEDNGDLCSRGLFGPFPLETACRHLGLASGADALVSLHAGKGRVFSREAATLRQHGFLVSVAALGRASSPG